MINPGGMPVNLIGAMQQMRISPNQQQPMMMMNPAGLVPGQIMYYEGSMNPYRSVYQTGMEAAKDFVGGSSSVWIGDLTPEVNERMLYEEFSKFGSVLSVKICREKTNHQKMLGFGYVNFSNPMSASAAIHTPKMLNGRPVRVRLSRYSSNHPKYSPANLFIGNLHREVTEAQLYQLFVSFGSIISIKISVDRSSNQSEKMPSTRVRAYVNFSEKSSSDQAIESLNGKFINNISSSLYVAKYVRREHRNYDQYDHKNTLKVSGLPKSHQNVVEASGLFEQYGDIMKCKMLGGQAYITFSSYKPIKKAVERLNGFVINGSTLSVSKTKKSIAYQSRGKFEIRMQGIPEGVTQGDISQFLRSINCFVKYVWLSSGNKTNGRRGRLICHSNNSAIIVRKILQRAVEAMKPDDKFSFLRTIDFEAGRRTTEESDTQ